MKRRWRILLAGVLLAAGCTGASEAQGPGLSADGAPALLGSAEIREYDVLRARSDGPSRGLCAEEALLERARLDAKTLRAYGYSDGEIALLRAYDGGPVEENPLLRDVMATLTCDLYRVRSDPSGMTVQFVWTWDSPPLFSGWGMYDQVGCSWVGVDSANEPHALSFQSEASWCQVDYHDTAYHHSTRITIDDAGADSYVEAQFPMGDTPDTWAKRGYLQVRVAETVPVGELRYGTLVFRYGHTSVAIRPALCVSAQGAGVSVALAAQTEERFTGSISAWTDGDYEFGGDAGK